MNVFSKKLTGEEQVTDALSVFTQASNKMQGAIDTLTSEQEASDESFNQTQEEFLEKERKYLDEKSNREDAVTKATTYLDKIKNFLES